MSWLILGCGYVGQRLARALVSDGYPVRACARDLAPLSSLARLGVEIRPVDVTRPAELARAFDGLTAPNVVYSVPPPSLPAGEAVSRAAAAAERAGANRFVYLGSTGVYGDCAPDALVDEDTPLAVADAQALPRIADERALFAVAGLDAIVLRLAAIYGPGRGLRERLRAGTLTLVDGGAGVFSRVHVDDIVGIIRLTVARAPTPSLFCVADDRPSTQREYVEHLCAELGLPLPPSAPPDPSKPRHAVRGRRVSNQRVKQLGYVFRYPTFVDGERAIAAELAV